MSCWFLHFLTSILKKILEKAVEIRRCLVNRPVVKWLVQKCTYRNLQVKFTDFAR